MKKIPPILILFSLISFVYASEASPLNEPECVTDYISSYVYMGDRVKVYFKSDDLSLYTTDSRAFSLIFSALENDMKVTIYANDCSDGAKFTKFAIHYY